MRLARRLLACLLALVLAMPTGALAYADENSLTGGDSQAVGARALGADENEIKIAVLSDMHYYPVNFVSDCEDYETYVGGDPKMLEESGSIAEAALQMVREDNPDILLVSGDLTKDGEIQGHRDLAAKFQKLEDETDIEVFVINGNHDLYNYTDACTFENGKKESAETTEQDDFKTIYNNFGYNGDYNAQYFENPNVAQGELAGQMSYTVDLGKFRIVAIDSCCYSPDGGNGLEGNEHITAGRIDEDLMPWVVDQIKDAEEAGDTVIGLMHHGVVPHFQGEEDLLYEYVVDDWQNVATQLADAGMRYVFTGHMHANDIAQYTSVSGNTITDLETGSLSSWMSPQRHVTIIKGEALSDGTNRTKESFSVTSHSVKSIDFTDHNGETQYIEDFRAYTQQKLYPETLFNNMANGMLRPILQEIGETGIRPWLAENLPDVDIDTMVLDVARDALADGMEIELGTGIGRVSVSYRNNGIQLQPSGTAGWALDDMTITDNQVLRLVDDVLNTVETKYIENPDWLLGEVDKIVTKVSNMGITSLTDTEHSIYDLVLVVLTGHYAGNENPPAWVESALAYIESGEIVQNLINTLKTDLMPIINTLLADNSIDTGIAFSGLWKTAIDAATDDGNLKETLDLFGFDEAAISELIDGLINEYLTPSFLTGMGSLISDVASSMLYDVNFTDDVIDGGDAVVIEFDGSKNAPAASVENGLLPTQVTMTLGADSENSRNFRWYTGLNVDSGTVQVATDSGFSNIVAEANASREEVVKPKTRMNLGLITTYGTQEAAKYSAGVTGLDDGTIYYYRVGDKDANLWSAAYQFTTGDAADGDDAFTFINVNDSQGMVESDYDVYLNTLAQADATFPTAAFTIHAGDFVDDGANEDYWTWALDDANGVAQGMAMTPAAGNHEAKSEVEGITDANPIVSHFNLANVPQGQDLSTGVYYSYVYKNATFVVLNTNDLSGNELSSTQYSWAYDTLANADTEWKIVLMHKSPYSNGPHQTDDDVLAIRSQINSLAAATDVDVVLSGHDHVYNRTPYLAHGNEQNVTTETQNYEGVNYETALNPSGTVFVIAGTCGVKNYAQDTSGGVPSEVALDLSVPVFTGITIDGDHLYYRAYKVEGGGSALVDSFAISKAEEDAAPAWKQVEDMIAALPEQSEVTTDDKAAIEAARVAYDELSAEDQQKVSNYDRLVAAERMLSLLQNVAGKRTVTVQNSGGLKTALEDSTVGTINVEGEIDSGEGLFTNGDRELYVTHDKVIGGTGKLTIFKFHVQNGATLVLKDSVYIDNTRTQGSTYRAWNPIEVHANSTLITQNDVSLRTEYGSGGSEEGVAVKLMESGATAILGSSGSYWGAEAAVLSTASGTTLVINDGTYNAKNNNRVVVDTHGDATVNGGTISSMWISGTLRVNGGTFEHQDSASSDWTPLAVSGGNAYITGGAFNTYGGRDGNASIKLENGAKLHVLADTNGAVKIGDTTPYVGSPSTSDYKNVKLGYVKSNGWNSSDGIYRVEGSVSASSVEDIAGLSASRLDTKDVSNNGNYMETVLPDGTSTVYGKYWIYGGNGGKGAPSGSGIIGSGDVIVYGPTRTIQNNPVTGVTIDGDDLRVVDLREEGADTIRLNGYTTPADAFDNGITWSSDNEQTASVVASAGQGVVTLKTPGGAEITATSASKPNLSDSVEIIAVKPEINGPDTVASDKTGTYEASAGFDNDFYRDRLSFKYSVDDNSIARIDAETGELTPVSRGTVEVTAELLVNNAETGIEVSKSVLCDLAPVIEEADEPEIANAAIDAIVSEGNELMTETHKSLTFDELIEGSYTFDEPYEAEAPASNPLEALGRLVGLAETPAQWRVDVTVNAEKYVEAFEKELEADGVTTYGEHVLQGDSTQTVTLLFDEEQGWVPETKNDATVSFTASCTTHTATFQYVGAPVGTEAPDAMPVQSGKTVTLPNTGTIEGYTFNNWFSDPECETSFVVGSLIHADITIYGKWTANQYIVSFDIDGDGQADEGIEPITVTYDSPYGALPTPTAVDGKKFTGWRLNEETVSADSTVKITENAVLTASWGDKTAITVTPTKGANSFTYDGNEHAFAYTIDPADVDGLKVEYAATGTDDWSETAPTNAGTYDVRVTRSEDADYAALNYEGKGVLTIAKAEQAAPTLTVAPGAESAIVTVDNDGLVGDIHWSDCETTWESNTYSTLESGTNKLIANKSGTYYFRVAGDNNHEPSEVASVRIVKVTFNAGDGQLNGNVAWLLAAGSSVGSANMPSATLAGSSLSGWQANGEPFNGTTAVSADTTVTAQWTTKTAIVVTPDEETNKGYDYDGKGKAFAFTVEPEGVTGLTVEYSVADANVWSETAPTDVGTYDVRVTRDEDETYAKVETAFEDALVISMPEPTAPTAPDADDLIAEGGVLYGAQFSVSFKDINEIYDGNTSEHRDWAYGTGITLDGAITGGELTVGEVEGSEGSWSVGVTVDAAKLLEDYSSHPEFGKHYFADPEETGEIELKLIWNEENGVWELAEGVQTSYTFDILCLTLRPANSEIYTGGASEDGGHFIDPYVVDGQGVLYTIDQLNELLGQGQTATIRYFDESGNEVTADTMAGDYEARIDIVPREAAAREGIQEVEESVELTVNGTAYEYALEPADLTIRGVSNAAEAEAGSMNVDLVAENDVAGVLANTEGGVVASVPEDATLHFNGNTEVPVDRADVTLFSDDLLPGNREDALIDRAEQALSIDLSAAQQASTYDFQYLDLVDVRQSNAWVSSSDDTAIYWRLPEGADASSIQIIHFKDLHRDTAMDDTTVADLIGKAEVETMEILNKDSVAADGYVKFAVPTSGFSPFLMVWTAADPGTDPDPEPQQFTVTFDAAPGALEVGFTPTATVTEGGTLATLPTASRTGYDFAGWQTADGDAFTTATPVSASMTVTAAWTPKRYDVTLQAQGGTFANGSDELVVAATYDATLPTLETPTRAGYDFAGWFTQATGGDEVDTGTSYQTAGDSTFYARWTLATAEKVDLTFNASPGTFDDGTATQKTLQVAKGGTLSSSDLLQPLYEGHTLEGWYLDDRFAQKVVLAEDAEPAAGINATTFSQNAMLHAKWLEDLSSDACISFTDINQPYTGSAVSAVPTFGSTFPEAERARVMVEYRQTETRSSEWSTTTPMNAGSYDVRFVYDGTESYAPFTKCYPAGIVITKAVLTQTGLVADPAEVEAGTALSDVKLAGGTVTMAGGTSVAGTWGWEDVDATVSQTGDYAAVFTPTKGAGNYQSLEVNVTITVNASGGEGPDPGVDPDPGPGTGGNPGGGPGADPEPEPEGSVQVPESEGGQTTVANPEARPGEAVSVSAAPADGWLVDRITVTDAEGNTVHVHYVGTGFYEFEMPEGGATVDVDYRKVTGALSFDDVAEGDWFFEVVGKVSGHGFMVGIGSTPLFDPNGSLDRAMMAQVIYNVAGRPSVDAAARLAFDDTPADAWYAEAVLWCAEEGVVGGYGGTNLYGPGDPVTREQLATMLWRLSGEPAAQEGALAAFPDAAAASDYAVSALCWAVEQGILRGDGGDGTLRPADTATRAEVATMVMRWWEDVALA